mmetsp:Transcript_5048/g.9015  ORF Transcript_5048/g.9015 Transcript_5048/m.9015 type:complete len:93 (+) Transcript_5048:1207-1485(+)
MCWRIVGADILVDVVIHFRNQSWYSSFFWFTKSKRLKSQVPFATISREGKVTISERCGSSRYPFASLQSKACDDLKTFAIWQCSSERYSPPG